MAAESPTPTLDRLSPIIGAHRSNSFLVIESALQNNPPMVEFDVHLDGQHGDSEFFLGHDERDASYERLPEALVLFKEHAQERKTPITIPKVDFKGTREQLKSKESLTHLADQLAQYTGPILLNLSHPGQRVVDDLHPEDFFTAADYMESERLFFEILEERGYSNIFLNLDPQRYKEHAGVADAEIFEHVGSIRPHVGSLSPEMTRSDIIELSYELAETLDIQIIGSWLHPELDHTTTVQEANDFFDECQRRGVLLIFDVIAGQILDTESRQQR